MTRGTICLHGIWLLSHSLPVIRSLSYQLRGLAVAHPKVHHLHFHKPPWCVHKWRIFLVFILTHCLLTVQSVTVCGIYVSECFSYLSHEQEVDRFPMHKWLAEQ